MALLRKFSWQRFAPSGLTPSLVSRYRRKARRASARTVKPFVAKKAANGISTARGHSTSRRALAPRPALYRPMLNCEIQERSNCNNESLHGRTALLIVAHRSQSFGDSIDVILIPLVARAPVHFAVRTARNDLDIVHSVPARAGAGAVTPCSLGDVFVPAATNWLLGNK